MSRRIVTAREQHELRLAMPTYYHVTTPSGLERIRSEGLIPQIGDRAKALGETSPGVYLFPSREDMDNALGNWFGEELEGEPLIHKLTLDLPEGMVEDSTVDYEKVSRQPIPFSHVTAIEDEADA